LDDLGPAFPHAVLPVDCPGANRAAAALGRIEACVAIVHRLHARDKKRRHQSKG
jgi:hypothetical protein